MTDKQPKELDIFDYLIRRDLSKLSTEELRKLRNISSDTCDGLMAGLKTIGELGFWACANEDYPDSQTRDDLSRISEMLMYLPRIVDALNANASDARFLIYQREGFPYTEVNNG